jgi:Tfp pilus assembly protein PilF
MALCGFILLAVVLVFGQLGTYGFIHFDDLEYVVKNKMVGAGLTWEGIKWAFTTTFQWQWHPVTWLSHMVDVQLFGMKPGMHHLVNLFFHTANSLLLFLFFRRATGAPFRSAMVAALFALHPLHVETIAMVADRKDLLSTFFLFLGLNAWIGFTRKGGWGRYGLVFVLFVLGLMAKTVVVILPVLLLLMDFWPLGRFGEPGGEGDGNNADGWKSTILFGKNRPFRLVLEKIILFAPMAVMAVVAILVRNPDKSLLRLPTWHHIQNGLVSYVLYLGKTLWPSNLAVIYPPPGRYSLGTVVASGLLLFAITAAVLLWRRRKPWIAVGWFWYLLTLLPVIGILGYIGPHKMADRYAYVPIAGLFVMVAWGVPDLTAGRRSWRTLVPYLAGGLVFLLMAASWLQTSYWKNSIFLFSHASEVTDDNYEALNNLGQAYAVTGDDRLAKEKLLEALEIKTDFVAARVNLGVLYKQQGELQKAEEQFREALDIDPNNAGIHNNIGLVFGEQGQLTESLVHLRQAVEMAPGEARMQYGLGNILLRLGETSEAVIHLTSAVQAQPDFAEAHNALGYALALLGDVEAAAVHFESALRIEPAYREAAENLERARSMIMSSDEKTR